MARPYTGTKDAPHPKARQGTIAVYDWLRFLFGLKGLGVYANRNVRGVDKAQLSVHATFRAMDLGGTPEQLHNVIDWAYRNRLAIGVEEIHDYAGNYIPNPKGWGAGYRCSRDWGRLMDGWKVYSKNTIGSPGAHWIHIEISPAIADSTRQQIDAIFTKLLEA
jgi:hypothetical protein